MFDKFKSLFNKPKTGNFYAVSSAPVAPQEEKLSRGDGFYRVRSISGADAGLGFLCPRCCAYQIKANAPLRVEHCGWLYVAPVDLSTLPEIQLKPSQGCQRGSGVSTGRSTLVDLWGADSAVEYEGNNPSGGVGWK